MILIWWHVRQNASWPCYWFCVVLEPDLFFIHRAKELESTHWIFWLGKYSAVEITKVRKFEASCNDVSWLQNQAPKYYVLSHHKAEFFLRKITLFLKAMNLAHSFIYWEVKSKFRVFIHKFIPFCSYSSSKLEKGSNKCLCSVCGKLMNTCFRISCSFNQRITWCPHWSLDQTQLACVYSCCFL